MVEQQKEHTSPESARRRLQVQLCNEKNRVTKFDVMKKMQAVVNEVKKREINSHPQSTDTKTPITCTSEENAKRKTRTSLSKLEKNEHVTKQKRKEYTRAAHHGVETLICKRQAFPHV